MGDRDTKQLSGAGGGKAPTRGPVRPPPLARSHAGPTDRSSVWLAPVAAALANPQRQICKLLLTENAGRRLARQIDTA